MAGDFADDRQSAYDMIAEDGSVCKLTLMDGSDASIGVPCLLADYSWNERRGDLIGPRDKKVLIPALNLGIGPDPNIHRFVLTEAVIGVAAVPVGTPLEIVTAVPTAPDNTPIFWELQVRL